MGINIILINLKNLQMLYVTIAIMSGNFVMRGEPAIYNKFTRAKMALSTADLVIQSHQQLPVYHLADHFAELAVKVRRLYECRYNCIW